VTPQTPAPSLAKLSCGGPQSGASTAQWHRAGRLELVTIEVEDLQVFLDHALDHNGFVILAERRTLTPMPYLSLGNFS
jgi:hypothetical protein